MEINKIYNEDCLDTMIRMEDNLIDLTVTSPPYDDLRNYKGFSFEFEEVAKELYRVTKKGGVVAWIVGDSTKKGSESGTSFRQALYFKDIGFNLHDTMIYRKANPIPLTHNRYEQCFEYMFILSKGRPNIFNPIMTACKNPGKPEKYGQNRRQSHGKNHSMRLYEKDEVKITNTHKISDNIFSYSIGAKTGHAAPFPEKLASDHIISWSNEGGLVYDPFMGSGTTAKMAKANGRNFIGSEISAEYCQISRARVR